MPLIIPIFIMNRGCPHRCLFCNERLTAGDRPDHLSAAAFRETVRACLGSAGRKSAPVQIAFYGGNFTGMAREEQRRLLELAAPFLREGAVDGVRISTRPDNIDPDELAFLASSGVKTVEVGAQSLDDEVLSRSRRGHSSADAVRAVYLLKERGFETGAHLMVGLPGDSPDRFADTIAKVIALRPDMVRIHPTIVLRGTPLATDFREKRYIPLTLAEAVDLCKNALKKLTSAGIPVIRLGLQTTRELEEPGAVVAGPFHPAFRALVESAIFLEMAEALLAAADDGEANMSGVVAFSLSPADLSNFLGRRRMNIAALKGRFGLDDVPVVPDPVLPRRTLVLTAGRRVLRTDWSGLITEKRREDLTAS
ncbi:MAG: radical SAM protein [Proteobacteria bacterium]|nr:radical SAM protein [Pseudomonadota bacterium]MBU2260991.1 radical SAM protein [Pseudomonadota bacterium]